MSTIRGDVLESDRRHIIFGINREGICDSGFAGTTADMWWPELRRIGEHELGSAVSCRCGPNGATLHALVCHSLQDGWEQSDEHVRSALEKLDIPEGEIAASVVIGGGLIGLLGGADIAAIMGVFEQSKHKIEIYIW